MVHRLAVVLGSMFMMRRCAEGRNAATIRSLLQGVAAEYCHEGSLILVQGSAQLKANLRPAMLLNSMEDGTAFSEEGYQSVVAQKNDEAMKTFIRSLLVQSGRQVLDEGELSGFAQYYSGTIASQTFTQLDQELREPHIWIGSANSAVDALSTVSEVEQKAPFNATATHANESFSVSRRKNWKNVARKKPEIKATARPAPHSKRKAPPSRGGHAKRKAKATPSGFVGIKANAGEPDAPQPANDKRDMPKAPPKVRVPRFVRKETSSASSKDFVGHIRLPAKLPKANELGMSVPRISSGSAYRGVRAIAKPHDSTAFPDVQPPVGHTNFSHAALESHGMSVLDGLRKDFESQQLPRLRSHADTIEKLKSTNIRINGSIEAVQGAIWQANADIERLHTVNERFRDLLRLTKPKVELAIDFIQEVIDEREESDDAVMQALQARKAPPSMDYLVSTFRSELRPATGPNYTANLTYHLPHIAFLDTSDHRVTLKSNQGQTGQEVVHAIANQFSFMGEIADEVRYKLEDAYAKYDSQFRRQQQQLFEEQRILNRSRAQLELDLDRVSDVRRSFQDTNDELSGRIALLQSVLGKISSAANSLVSATVRNCTGGSPSTSTACIDHQQIHRNETPAWDSTAFNSRSSPQKQS